MKRKIDAVLQDWARGEDSRPLLLRGVRRVGKTYCAKVLGKSVFKEAVSLDFQTDLERVSQIFEGPTDVRRIIKEIEAYADKPISPRSTLIIFDEVQLNEKALNSLRFFADSPYWVLGTGSQLGLTLRQRTLPFPSDVKHVYVRPLDFEEFLWAKGNQHMADSIRQAYHDKRPYILHEEALALYREYLVVGGMPKPVESYCKMEDFKEVRERQGEIDEIFISDMSLHAPQNQVATIRMIWQSLPGQLARERSRKFKFSEVKTGGRSDQFEGPLGWLEAAEMIKLNRQTTQTSAPLEARAGNYFKVYMEDTGLLFKKYGLKETAFLDESSYQVLSANFRGALAENYVMQALTSNDIKTHYWADKSGAHEVEFIFSDGLGRLVPIEVKSGSNVRAKSLRYFLDKSYAPYGIRISSKNFGFDNGIFSVPLYAAFCINPE